MVRVLDRARSADAGTTIAQPFGTVRSRWSGYSGAMSPTTPGMLPFSGDPEADALLAHEPMALLIGFAQTPALARPGGGPGGALKEVLKSLNLTDEQKEKIKAIRQAGKEANKELRESLKEGRKSLKDLMTGDGKKEEILAKFDSLQGSRNKMARARFEQMISVRDVLTPEQRVKFRAFLDKHAGRFMKRQGPESEEN